MNKDKLLELKEDLETGKFHDFKTISLDVSEVESLVNLALANCYILVGDELPEPEEGIEYLCVDDEGVKWLCEYDYNQNDEAVFTVLGSAAQPEPNSICYWMPTPQLNSANKEQQ